VAAEAEVWAGRDTVEGDRGRDLEWVVAEALAEAEALAGEALAQAGPGRASEVVPVLEGLAHLLCGNQAEDRVGPVAEVELEPEADLAVEVVLEVEPV